MKDWKKWILMLLLMSWITPMTFGERSGEMTESEFADLILNRMISEHLLNHGFAEIAGAEMIAFDVEAWIQLNRLTEAEIQARASEAVKVAVIPLKGEIAEKDTEIENLKLAGKDHLRDVIIAVCIAGAAGALAATLICIVAASP